MRKVTIAAALGLLAPMLASGTASAQEWLKDRRYQEGPGYRTGDLELHPGLGGEIGYDSNWFLRSDKTGAVNGCPSTCPQGAPEMRITPSLSLATLSPQRREGDVNVEPPSINFRAGLAATYREFFGTLSPEQRNVSGRADARLEILPERPWGAAIYGNYERTIQPNVFANPDLAFNRDDVGAGGEVIAQPGGGTLDWRLGYQFHDTIFEDTGGQPYGNITNEANTRGRWKFRPRTALLYDATLRFIHYLNGGTGGVTTLHDSTPVRARIGLNGLITPRFSLLAMVGYGASFYNPGADATVHQYDSIIGTAEAKFYLTAVPGDEKGASLSLSSIAVGYNRDFQNSYLADYYGSDRGYVKFSYFFAGRALISIEGGAGAVEYPTINIPPPGAPHAGFTDVRLDGTIFGEYRFTDSLGINATFRYTSNLSNQELTLGPGQLYAMQWQRFEGFLGFRWLM